MTRAGSSQRRTPSPPLRRPLESARGEESSPDWRQGPVAASPRATGCDAAASVHSENATASATNGTARERMRGLSHRRQPPPPGAGAAYLAPAPLDTGPSQGSGLYPRHADHPQVQELLASLTLQAAWRGREARLGADAGHGDAGTAALDAKRLAAMQTVRTPMVLSLDRLDCLCALFLRPKSVRWMVWLVQTWQWSALNVAMTALYTAHLVLLFFNGQPFVPFMGVNFSVAVVCILAQLLTMNLALFGLAHRSFEAWLNYLNVARWAITFALTFQILEFKIYLIPSLGGAILLWNSADAMQMRIVLRIYIAFWLVIYWLVLAGAASQLYLYEDVEVEVPFVRYPVSLLEHHQAALFTLMLFVFKDILLEVAFPGCCKIIKRKVRKRYERTSMASVARTVRSAVGAVATTQRALHSPRPATAAGQGAAGLKEGSQSRAPPPHTNARAASSGVPSNRRPSRMQAAQARAEEGDRKAARGIGATAGAAAAAVTGAAAAAAVGVARAL